MPAIYTPPTLPSTRILGPTTQDRRLLLIQLDVIVGYVCAKHRHRMRGWIIEAALVDGRSEFRGGERVALRALPEAGTSLLDIAPLPGLIMDEIIDRISEGVEGIAALITDVACIAPDVAGAIANDFRLSDGPRFFGFGSDDSAIA